MNWIEQLFHIAPDNGNGSTEALFAFALGVVVLGLVWWRRARSPLNLTS